MGIGGYLPGSAGSCPSLLCHRDNDELDRYLMRDTEDELPDGPLSYWQEHSNDIRSNNANVGKMALEVFSIPAVSANPERLFSRCVSGSLKIYSNHTPSLIADISFLCSTKLLITD